jgi:hypothetical protein
MMFSDCPTLATAIVFGVHVEMKAAFTNPLIAAPLASFVPILPCHYYGTVHAEMNRIESRFS